MRLLFITILTIIVSFKQTASFSLEQDNDDKKNNNIMFSSRIQQDNKKLSKQILFVVKNNDCFLVKFNNGKYLYEKPEDKCYELENNLNICVENGKIGKITGQHHNLYKDNNRISGITNDWFFQEKTMECNEMKFDIVKNFFIENKEITYIQYQLYILNYFDIVRLVIFENQANSENEVKNTKNSLLAFTITYSNEVGCSIYDKFKTYELKIDKDKKKKKKKKQQTQKKGRKFEEIEKFNEIFQNLSLKNIQYLQPTNSNRIDEDTVIVLNNNVVEKINIVALDINWKKTNGKSLIKTDV